VTPLKPDHDRNGKVKTLSYIALLLAMATSPTLAGDETLLRWATATKGGGFQLFGEKIAEVINQSDRQLKVKVLATKGSRHNLALLEAGDVDVGQVEGNAARIALGGIGGPPLDLKVLSVMYPNPGMFVVRGDSRYQSIDDLKGRPIAFGTKASGLRILANDVLDGLGLEPDKDFQQIILEKAADGPKFVSEGRAEALWGAGIGWPGFVKVAGGPKGGRFIPPSKEEIGLLPHTDDVVKITPLGSHAGEFCRFDRALIFEDPDGTRLLYDAGRTVAGATDPRLGDIDVILVSHMHGDHVGDRHIGALDSGECAKPDFPVMAVPGTNSVSIALAKNAKIVTGSEMPRFFGNKLKALGGNPEQSQLVRFGASRQINGVTLTTVPATHSNGIAGAMIGGKLGAMLDATGLTAYAGPPTGYVLTFSNGLKVYLSGDTGITAEQETVVRAHYGVQLVVINIGDTFTTGPEEAAYVVNELIEPKAVIPSHANEQATSDGKILPGTRTGRFLAAAQMPVHIPLSGKTMAFDAKGLCQSGCD
jgi:TRAP transporter TAXI family solute receptor